MFKVAGYHCTTCQGQRLHRVRVRNHPDGKVTRARECTACSTQTDLTYQDDDSGVICPACSHTELQVVYTRHRQGVTVRVKQCTHCRHCVRTVERFEALAHKSKGKARSVRLTAPAAAATPSTG